MEKNVFKLDDNTMVCEYKKESNFITITYHQKDKIFIIKIDGDFSEDEIIDTICNFIKVYK